MLAAMNKGRQLPEWFLNEPVISSVDVFYIEAFWELITGRNQYGTIHWRDIEDYADRRGLEQELLGFFKRVIRGLETTFTIWNESTKNK